MESGMKNARTISKSHITIFTVHPPWCHESRLSFWSFTPIIMRAKTTKNRQFPKLTWRTACTWYHSFVWVSDESIPASLNLYTKWKERKTNSNLSTGNAVLRTKDTNSESLTNASPHTRIRNLWKYPKIYILALVLLNSYIRAIA